MNKKDIERWIKATEEMGLINCSEDWVKEEYNFILDMAKKEDDV